MRKHRRLSALAVPIVKPPTTQPWGLRSVWLRDPDGNLVNCYAKVPQQDAPPRPRSDRRQHCTLSLPGLQSPYRQSHYQPSHTS